MPAIITTLAVFLLLNGIQNIPQKEVKIPPKQEEYTLNQSEFERFNQNDFSGNRMKREVLEWSTEQLSSFIKKQL